MPGKYCFSNIGLKTCVLPFLNVKSNQAVPCISGMSCQLKKLLFCINKAPCSGRMKGSMAQFRTVNPEDACVSTELCTEEWLLQQKQQRQVQSHVIFL